MGRAPCCEKMGLKKGPWTTEEDLILVTFINQHGHGNWRNLPKRAGLLRCGKSCRLRWMNYLRPDIKRGNFTKEEEESIMKLHQELGNRWSVIAARLPGRTDNEIKNVWHTHLKKKLLAKKSQPEPEIEIQAQTTESSDSGQMEDTNSDTNSSPPHSSSEISSLNGGAAGSDACRITETFDNLLEMDESFWSEVFSGDDSGATSNFLTGSSDFDQLQFSNSNASDLNTECSMDFWYNLFNRAEGIIELPHDF